MGNIADDLLLSKSKYFELFNSPSCQELSTDILSNQFPYIVKSNFSIQTVKMS